MGKILFFTLTFLALTLIHVNGDGFYTIVAPTTVRANSRYHMSLATTGLRDPMDVLITLTNEKLKLEKLVTVQPNSAMTAYFDIAIAQYYELRVQGLSGIQFNETASLSPNRKERTVLIQTDKAMYKPSDRVQFRILVIDGDTKPVDTTNRTIEVYVTDPKHNRIKQWQNVTLSNGVFKGDLKLAREPAKGKWTLHFKYGRGRGEIKTKSWQVAEYVLPKFEVITSEPVYNTYKSGKVIFGVEAKYTFGKPVKGTLTVKTEKPSRRRGRGRSISSEPERYNYKVIPIDGKATVELDMKELQIHESSETQNKEFELTVLEELTGITIQKSITVPIYERDYQISHQTVNEKFKPGLRYGLQVKVTRPDGKPMVDKVNPVNITVYYGFDDRKSTNLSFKLDDQGTVFVGLTVPLSASVLNFIVRYREAEPYSVYLAPAESDSNQFIQANILTKPMDIFKFVRIQVKSTEPMKYFFYQVIGRGGVMTSHRKKAHNSKVFVFRFWATFSMVPEAALVVYYYRPNGEIVADRVTLKFETRLNNYANIKLSATQLEPGNLLDITVDTKCNSYVGLLGIDQSVKLLSTGNDIDKQTVFSELKEYYSPGSYYSYPRKPRISFRPYYSKFKPQYKLLAESGAFFFTNAKAYEINRTGSREKTYSKKLPKRAMKAKRVAKRKAARKGAKFEGSGSGDEITVRSDFPETWIWEDIMSGCEPIKFSKKVPDTITSWLISAFSLNQANGLGLNDDPTSLTVFRPFFISTTLPYSVKRGERLTLSIQIFNYLSDDQDVSVTMSNEAEQFEFTDDTDSNYEDNLSRMNTVTVASNTGATITFTVTPKKVGYLPVKITARCELAGDAVEQLLLVEPEGSPIYVNKAVLLDLRTVDAKSATFTIETPADAVPESTSAELSVFGDILGNTIQNLGSLIRVPSGCGEQNMIAFVPNLLVADYLTAAQQLTTELRTRIVSNLEIGFQGQLNYQRRDGSFSCFGQSDISGSTWLTAFVVRYFAEAKRYIKIDDGVMTRAMDWLVGRQSENGRFIEVGKSVVYELQSEVSEGVGLTAHVLLALMANNPNKKYDAAIQNATEYIIDRLKTVDHIYSLALSAYALQKAGHSKATELLENLGTRGTENFGLKWWDNDQNPNIGRRRPYASTTSIEITAIALAAYAEAGVDTEVFPILQWLIKERNSRGGYYSTQDSILSIQAMAKVASRLYVKETNINVKVSYEPDGLYNLNVNRENAIVLQSYELPLNTELINFDFKGSGFAVAQVAYKYYVQVPEPEPRFKLNVKILESSTAQNLNLTICSSFVADEKAKESSMAIVEVTFPSGYTFNRDTLDNLRLSNDVSRVETKDLDTVLMVYYYSIGETEVCLVAASVKTSNVALLKPAPVRVYDYYDNSKRAREFYDITSLNDPSE